MGFVLTIVYIVLTIISPEQFGPEWTTYHALFYLALITTLFSFPTILTRSHLKSSIQTYLLIGFIIAIGLSQVANHWVGGAIQSWLKFLPSAAVYFFIVANATTVRRLKTITLAAVGTCLALVGEAFCGYYGQGFLNDTFVLRMHFESGQTAEQILRLRAVGFLNDPNDFAQILIIALALLFIAWRKGRVVSNFLFVLAPALVLLWAIYLTHSRGALIGLVVLALTAGYKRLGKIPSLILAGMLAVGMMALDFTGGRGISASEGADRLTLWATGLELFKQAPIFGVGFGNFMNFSDHTAHNSLVLPLAELGLVGATIWLALLVTTTMDLNRLISHKGPDIGSAGQNGGSYVRAREDEEEVSDFSFDADQEFGCTGDELATEHDLVEGARMEEQSFTGGGDCEKHQAAASVFSAGCLPKEEANLAGEVKAQMEIDSAHELIVPDNWLVIMRLALISFMATGWFLSRTYDTTIYLVLGLATAAIALDRTATETRDRGRWMYVTLAVEALAIMFVYFVVRFRH